MTPQNMTLPPKESFASTKQDIGHAASESQSSIAGDTRAEIHAEKIYQSQWNGSLRIQAESNADMDQNEVRAEENWNQRYCYQNADVELSTVTRSTAGMNDCSTEYDAEGNMPCFDNITTADQYENSARGSNRRLIQPFSMHRYLAEAPSGVEMHFSAYSLTVDPYDQHERGMRNQVDRLGQLDRVLSDFDRTIMATPEEKHIQIESRNDGASSHC